MIIKINFQNLPVEFNKVLLYIPFASGNTEQLYSLISNRFNIQSDTFLISVDDGYIILPDEDIRVLNGVNTIDVILNKDSKLKRKFLECRSKSNNIGKIKRNKIEEKEVTSDSSSSSDSSSESEREFKNRIKRNQIKNKNNKQKEQNKKNTNKKRNISKSESSESSNSESSSSSEEDNNSNSSSSSSSSSSSESSSSSSSESEEENNKSDQNKKPINNQNQSSTLQLNDKTPPNMKSAKPSPKQRVLQTAAADVLTNNSYFIHFADYFKDESADAIDYSIYPDLIKPLSSDRIAFQKHIFVEYSLKISDYIEGEIEVIKNDILYIRISEKYIGLPMMEDEIFNDNGQLEIAFHLLLNPKLLERKLTDEDSNNVNNDDGDDDDNNNNNNNKVTVNKLDTNQFQCVSPDKPQPKNLRTNKPRGGSGGLVSRLVQNLRQQHQKEQSQMESEEQP